MEREGMVARDEAVLMVEPRHLDQLLHPMFEGARPACLAQGLACLRAPCRAACRCWRSRHPARDACMRR